MGPLWHSAFPFSPCGRDKLDPTLTVAHMNLATMRPSRKKHLCVAGNKWTPSFLTYGIPLSSFSDYRQLDLLHLLANVCRRGIPLSSFSDYRQLDLLHLLANVCRHGDGPSSKKLWHRCPEFWPNGPSDPGRVRGSTPTTTSMAICRDHLQTFVDAIISFWQEVEYIYLESIERKHESVEKKLLQLRDERAKMNRCNFYARDKEVEPIVDASVCQNIHELTRGSTDV